MKRRQQQQQQQKLIRSVVSIFLLSLLIVSGTLVVVLSPFTSSAETSSSTSSNTSSQGGVNNGTLKLTLVGTPTTLNEINASESLITGEICVSCWQIIQLEYASGMPVLQNGYNNTKAGLFDWFTSNPSATIWDFNIRPNATWSDGYPINSSDINFTFSIPQVLFTLWTGMSKYVIPTITSLGNLTGPIENIKIINSSETQFTLLESDSTFGALVSSQYFFAPLPMHIWQNRNVTNDLNFEQDVTSGPFYHLNYTAGSSVLILKQNPYYWDKSNISEIIVTFVSNNNEAASLLQGNQTDLATINPDNVTSFLGKPNFGLDYEHDRSLLYLNYNITASPFNSTGFREAIADSINTSSIAQSVYDGYATPGYEGEGLIPPSATTWYNSSEVQYQYDLALAAKNLTSLGYNTVDGKLEYPNGSAVKFTIYTDTNNSADYASAKIVASDLSALNMSVDVIAESLMQLTLSNAYSLGNTTNELVVASTQLPLFGVGYADVLPAYQDYFPWSPYLEYATYDWILPQNIETEYNNLFLELNTSTNPVVMRSAVMAMDGLNSQYLPMIPLAYPYEIWAYNNVSFTGFPTSNSAQGLDMGALALDPTTFSSISAKCAPNCPPPTNSSTSTTTSTGVTTTTSSSTTSTSSSSVGPPPNSDLLLVIAIVVVIALIAAATFLARRRTTRRAQ